MAGARVHQGHNYYGTHSSHPPPPPPTPPIRPRPLDLPPRDKDFFGREDILHRLDELLPVLRYHNRASLTGIGGIGKSQIAIEYAHRYATKHDDHWIFWIFAATRERFNQAYKEIALTVRALTDPSSTFSAADLKRWLSDVKNGPWLMILNYADDKDLFFTPNNEYHALRGDIPQCAHGSVLVTSRNGTGTDLVDRLQNSILVEAYDEATSLKLLLKKIPQQYVEQDAKRIASRLDYIPLALLKASMFISRNGLAISAYLQIFNSDEQKQIQLLGHE